MASMVDRTKARIIEKRYRDNFKRRHGTTPTGAWYNRNLETARASRRNSWKELRKQVIKAYGGKCKCCGESIFEFLELDHINCDGARERRELSTVEGKMIRPCQFYQWLRNNGFPGKDTRYQLLCSNCNQGRHRNHGVCPHEELRRGAATNLPK